MYGVESTSLKVFVVRPCDVVTDRSVSFLLFVVHVCLCYTVLSLPCSLDVTCWERAELLSFCYMYMMFLFVFAIFSYGVVIDCINSKNLPSFLLWSDIQDD